MSEVRVNKLSPRSGTTVTLGDSGDTITIPSGVTLSTASFSSTGIDDNATSTAITIDSSQRVGIGTASPARIFSVNASTDNTAASFTSTDANCNITFVDDSTTADGYVSFGCTGDDAVIRSGNSESMRIDSSGNVGIGTTSPESPLHVVGTNQLFSPLRIQAPTTNGASVFSIRQDATQDRFTIGLAYSSSSVVMGYRVKPSNASESDATGFLSSSTSNVARTAMRFDTNGHIQFYNAPQQNTAVDSVVAMTERMRIDNSGFIGIGTASPQQLLDISSTGPRIRFTDTSVTNLYHVIGSEANDLEIRCDDGNVQADSHIGFKIDGSERMRITSTGAIRTQNNDATDAHNIGVNREGVIINFVNAGSSPYGPQVYFSGASPDNNTNYFFKCLDTTTDRLIIYSDGDVANHDGVYGSISDERIKQDIVDSNSQWDDIKAVRVRNFKKKDDVRQYGENAKNQIGVIAQELETISPSLIKHKEPSKSDILSDSSFGTLYEEGDEIPEGKEIGDVKEVHQQVKSVSYSILYMKAIKALQEAMTRIETLEAKVQTLENNQP